MSVTDGINLFSAASSIVLAIVALWLSVVFYRMSSEQAHRSSKSADDIASSVKRLEVLFDRLYSDTFSIMKDTVGDMRTYILQPSRTHTASGHGTSDSPSSRESVKADLVERIAELSARLGLAEGSLHRLREELPHVIDTAAGEDTDPSWMLNHDRIEEVVIRTISDRPGIEVGELFEALRNEVDEGTLAGTLFALQANGMVRWGRIGKVGDRDRIFPGSEEVSAKARMGSPPSLAAEPSRLPSAHTP